MWRNIVGAPTSEKGFDRLPNLNSCLFLRVSMFKNRVKRERDCTLAVVFIRPGNLTVLTLPEFISKLRDLALLEFKNGGKLFIRVFFT